MSKLVVETYLTIKDAEDAIGVLRHHGFPIDQVTVVAKEFSSERATADHKAFMQKTGSLRNWFAEYFGWMVPLIDGSVFQEHFHAGKYLVVAHGSEEDGAQAYAIIRETEHLQAEHFSEEE